MTRESRHEILFEPIQVGPKILKNRFWQVPHCNGAGSERPGMQAAFREVKAEGGWAAVFTEVCFFTFDSDITPWVGSRLIDQGDMRNLALMCDSIHKHGALAGVELTHGSSFCLNAESRMPGRAPSQIPHEFEGMASAREMSKVEIRKMQIDHVEGALKARETGFDLLTIFAGLATLPNYFLYPFNNKRTDEYGGSFENRCRFSVELLEMIREKIDDCAIGMRFPIDTLEEPYGYGDLGVRAEEEGARFIEAMDHLVDYWDINIGTLNWGEDAGSSRFFESNHQSQYTKHAKRVSKKPIVNVGRFTDPDLMVKVLNSNQCDIIGAARPSIADPFLPKKIEEGRYEDIRECIGCNICVSRWEKGGPPIWCTQNPTSGEEYRRNWHPEIYLPTTNPTPPVMVIGAGPAGLECAMTLGLRGYDLVHVSEAKNQVGGHVDWVSKLPGFGAWRRVIDWRETQIKTRTNVQIMLNSDMSYEDVLRCGAEHLIFATGSHWDGSGMSALLHDHIEGVGSDLSEVATPEQYVLGDKQLGENVLVIDNDAYYMGSAMAQLLAENGHKVTYVTYGETVGPYLRFTLEEQRMYETLMQLGCTMIAQHLTVAAENGKAVLVHIWSGKEQVVEYDSIMLVTHRISNCEIYNRLQESPDAMEAAGIKSIHLIGDAHTPGMIAQAVFSGTRLAREFDSDNPEEHKPFIRERRLLNATEADYRLDADTLVR